MYKSARRSVNGYEVTTRGDRRFSAFVARLKDGRTIEEAYQLDVKGYRKHGFTLEQAKGKPPVENMSIKALYSAYLELWRTWALENHELIEELRILARKHNNTLTDMFASTDINQARALAEILNDTES